MFTVAVIGRPNVGKSTLFNRLTGTNHALVDDLPGVTRDRREGDARLGPLEFKIIDTAGLEESNDDQLEYRMFQQTEMGIDQADIALMVIDAKVGVTPMDRFFANWLRQKTDKVILVANKCDAKHAYIDHSDIYKLGLGEEVAISAEHGLGMADLYTALEPHHERYIDEFADVDLELQAADENGDRPMQIAVIGRPNSGKSTFINALLQDERLLTGPEAGITRDSIAINWCYRGENIRLIDTAGIRKKSKINDKLEKLSVGDCFRATRYAHVCILMLDSTQPLEKQDISIANMMIKEGRAVVIAANKWDLIENEKELREEMRYIVDTSLPHIKGVPIVTLSALKRQNILKIINAAQGIYKLWNKRMTTARMNDWLKSAESRHLVPLGANGRRVRLKYITQGNTRPPTFTLFVNNAESLPASYRRYLVNSLRDTFDMPGVPIRLMLRKSDNPYENRRKKRK